MIQIDRRCEFIGLRANILHTAPPIVNSNGQSYRVKTIQNGPIHFTFTRPRQGAHFSMAPGVHFSVIDYTLKLTGIGSKK